MTLLIRWDSSDTTYISGEPGNRYVHFPVEVASTVDTMGGVAVTALDAGGGIIVQQSYEGIPLTSNYAKFSPAVLLPDTSTPVTLKVLLYSVSDQAAIPRLITLNLGGGPTGSYLKYVFLAGLVILLGSKIR